MKSQTRYLTFAILALAGPVAAQAQEYRELNVKKGRLEGDQYLSGATVDVLGRVQGDLNMVGLQAGLDGDVTGDVNAAALLVHVGGGVGDDARALGGKVIVESWIGDGLLVAGGDVSIVRGTLVGGNAILGGLRIVDRGDVHGSLHAAGESVEIDGDVRGATRIRSDHVVIGPRARLFGDLLVVGRNPPRIADGARITGKVTTEPWPASGGMPWPRAALLGLLVQLGMLLVAGGWMALAPSLARDAAALEWRSPWFAEALGVTAVAGLPLAAGALALSLVGMPAAVGVASAWVLLVLAGYSTTAICLGAWMRSRLGRGPAAPLPWERLLWTLAALLALRAAAEVPWVGWMVPVGAVLAGAGAVARAARIARARAGAVGAAPGPTGDGV